MTKEPRQARDPSELSYEEARDELADIVARLEEGTASLDDSLTLWERGETLAKRCTQWLDSAQTRLDSVGKNPPAPESSGQRAEQTSEAGERGASAPSASAAGKSVSDVQRLPRPAPAAPALSAPNTGADDNSDAEVAPPPPPKPVSPLQSEEPKPKLRPVPNTDSQPTGPKPGKPTDPPW